MVDFLFRNNFGQTDASTDLAMEVVDNLSTIGINFQCIGGGGTLAVVQPEIAGGTSCGDAGVKVASVFTIVVDCEEDAASFFELVPLSLCDNSVSSGASTSEAFGANNQTSNTNETKSDNCILMVGQDVAHFRRREGTPFAITTISDGQATPIRGTGKSVATLVVFIFVTYTPNWDTITSSGTPSKEVAVESIGSSILLFSNIVPLVVLQIPILGTATTSFCNIFEVTLSKLDGLSGIDFESTGKSTILEINETAALEVESIVVVFGTVNVPNLSVTNNKSLTIGVESDMEFLVVTSRNVDVDFLRSAGQLKRSRMERGSETGSENKGSSLGAVAISGGGTVRRAIGQHVDKVVDVDTEMTIDVTVSGDGDTVNSDITSESQSLNTANVSPHKSGIGGIALSIHGELLNFTSLRFLNCRKTNLIFCTVVENGSGVKSPNGRTFRIENAI